MKNVALCKLGYAAFGVFCAQDQYGRPVGLSINFCPSWLTGINTEEEWETFIEVTIHEFLHPLVFSRELYGSFVDEERKFS